MATDATKFRNVQLPASLHDRLRVAADERGLQVHRLATILMEQAIETLIPVEELRLTRVPTSSASGPRVPEPLSVLTSATD